MNLYALNISKMKTQKLSTVPAPYPFLIIGCAEAILGVFQLVGICSSSHPDYPFTGSFYNPGPFACYLAVLLPMAVFAFRNTGHKLKFKMARWLGMGMLLVCAILIPASLSRTAMIATAVGTTIAYWDEFKTYLEKHKVTYFIGILIAVIILSGSLYAVKKDSADGRLVMWKVGMQAAVDASLTGVGWDNVAGAYGEAQERYFESGRGSEEEMKVADAPEYVFNEYLQIAIAFGPFALLAMVGVMGWAFIVAFRSGTYGIAGSISAIAIVMIASYPLQFPLFTVTIAFILITSFLASFNQSQHERKMGVSGILLTALGCALLLTHNEKTDIENGFACGHSLHRSRDFRKSNAILIPLLQKSSDPMILNIIGKNYQALSMPDSAELYLRKSTFRCPNRMYPHYLLMLLYADSASFDRSKCLQEANTILTMPVKISSPAVEEIQKKAKSMINDQLSMIN